MQSLARFFFPSAGTLLEDPATGSATANFGGWCLAMQRPLPLTLEISQGELAGRPSILYLDVGRATFCAQASSSGPWPWFTTRYAQRTTGRRRGATMRSAWA